MEKISEGHYRFKARLYPADGVTLVMTVNRFDGEDLDTSVTVEGGFAISGNRREQFNADLGDLIDKYRL